MAKKKPEGDKPKKIKTRERKPGLDIPCPRCQRDVHLRGVGEDCFSGECGDCMIEIAAVVGSLGGKPTTECYPIGCDVPICDDPDIIEIEENDYDQYFPPLEGEGS